MTDAVNKTNEQGHQFDLLSIYGQGQEQIPKLPKRKGTTKAKGKKHQLDKFYTKVAVAESCLNILELNRYSRVIEPSAGAGAFSNYLQTKLRVPVLAFDLAPESERVIKQDWFEYNDSAPSPTLVVGNPPFGQQCSLALRFINHAFEVVGAQTVAFILPRSFRKASVQKRVFTFAKLANELDIKANSFELNGADYNLNAVFQVWERTNTAREDSDLPLTSRYFSFTKKIDRHHFAIRRVGGKAGHAFFDNQETSEQSNYFIKLFDENNINNVVNIINSIDFKIASDGTGPKTLSKRELVQLFDNAYSHYYNIPTSNETKIKL